jgi:ribosomal protein S18 acetylase RimI-like enzyme
MLVSWPDWMCGNLLTIRLAAAEDLPAIGVLFRAYAASIGVDLAYQDFEAELAGLPGKYAPPAGALLLATGPDGAPLGCVATRPLDTEGACEMKRLYVTPEAQGLGLGRRLAEAILAEAKARGYHQIRLDTLPTMGAAMALYDRLGFEVIAPYYDTPIAGTRFMAKQLATAAPSQSARAAFPSKG